MLELDLKQAERTFRQHLGDLAFWAGCFAVVTGNRLVGIFSTYEIAADVRLSMHNPDLAVICRIEGQATVVTPMVAREDVVRLPAGAYPVYLSPTVQRYVA